MMMDMVLNVLLARWGGSRVSKGLRRETVFLNCTRIGSNTIAVVRSNPTLDYEHWGFKAAPMKAQLNCPPSVGLLLRQGIGCLLWISRMEFACEAKHTDS